MSPLKMEVRTCRITCTTHKSNYLSLLHHIPWLHKHLG